MTLFEMIKTRPYEMQQEFSCGVRKQNENEVLVSVWRPKAKKCQLAVIGKAETVSDVSGENMRDGRLFYSCLTSGEFGRQASGNALFFCGRW